MEGPLPNRPPRNGRAILTFDEPAGNKVNDGTLLPGPFIIYMPPRGGCYRRGGKNALYSPLKMPKTLKTAVVY